MTENKHTSRIIITITAVAVLLCFVAICFADELTHIMGGLNVEMEYADKLFDTNEIMSVDIIMDDEAWNTMFENAATEEYSVCDVIINGTRFNKVGIRPKGNSSLTWITYNPGSDRYSLKLEFDHFVKGQTCFGLDKLVLNNNFADATNMKEALIFDMYQFLGADASLYNFAKISHNGSYWGVYLALEAVDESFMLRNFGTQDGELYKPEPSAMIMDEGTGAVPPKTVGANLDYANDAIYLYDAIWDSQVTMTNDADHKRVLKALKNISEKNELETYMDVDNLLRYMAVHTFAVNEDSLTWGMPHNYYLYEYQGKLNIFPWDYNLAFGAMLYVEEDDSRRMVNYPIDTPFDGTHFFDGLLENEEYFAKYHEYFQQLIDEYIYGGGFEKFYNRTRSQIDNLVATDPTAFYTNEEYQAAADMFYKTVMLRGESIKGQLDGSIASTVKSQRSPQGKPTLIDASEIDLKTMGYMDGEDLVFPEEEELNIAQVTQVQFENGIIVQKKPANTKEAILEITENYDRKNIIIYSVCFGVMIVSVITVKLLKRKRS